VERGGPLDKYLLAKPTVRMAIEWSVLTEWFDASSSRFDRRERRR